MRIALMFLLLCSTWSNAQFTTISGSVTDVNNDKALEGVLVTNQYTQVTTTTDQNGMYSIKAEKGNTLKFSLEEYAVLETMVKSTNKNIDVQLVPIVTLE